MSLVVAVAPRRPLYLRNNNAGAQGVDAQHGASCSVHRCPNTRRGDVQLWKTGKGVEKILVGPAPALSLSPTTAQQRDAQGVDAHRRQKLFRLGARREWGTSSSGKPGGGEGQILQKLAPALSLSQTPTRNNWDAPGEKATAALFPVRWALATAHGRHEALMRNTAASCCTAPPHDGANLASRNSGKTRGAEGGGSKFW
jgi:hypothetical protein